MRVIVMYCPKCKEKFEDGSRRFCPADGGRLISEAAEAGHRSGGIFSNLLPKIDAGREEAVREPDNTVLDIPHFFITESDQAVSSGSNDIAADYFEFEDIEPDTDFDFVEVPSSPDERVEIKPEARKVKPYEIPAGHVDLDGDGRNGDSADFRGDDPEGFIGRTVKGRYYVTELLGGDEDSFAYLGYDKIVGDKTVLVRIIPREGADELAARVIDDELVSLSHISHPNVARLIDSGQFTDKTRFLISEYVDALSVNDVLSIHGAICGLRSARIIRQVAYALNEAHQEGIVHRDLRPENIIISRAEDESEQAILVNFGASNGEPNDRNLGYKSPEVFDGRLSTISGDIFSLAVVAFEMLTGVLPFEGSKPNAMVRSQYAGPQRLPSEIRRELRPSIDRVFEKALAFSVADRFVKARDFGDAFYNALAETPMPVLPSEDNSAAGVETVKPETTVPFAEEPTWKKHAADPPKLQNTLSRATVAAGIVGFAALLIFGWYFLTKDAAGVNIAAPTEVNAVRISGNNSAPRPVNETEMPPRRSVSQPPNTNFYQNSKQDLKGDLNRNFLGFTLYYPKDWTVKGPYESAGPNLRGKFLDISRSSPEGRLQEQMLVSYYPSEGTFQEDTDKFPELTKETNRTLTKLLPGYRMVSEGEIKVNGGLRAYEIKFQGSGTAASGDKVEVWGRRLFIPTERPGVTSGFEITMLATSASTDVHSVDDVGVRGELARILDTFEPSQNF
jgi:serine/threonine protein kinase